MKRTKKGFTIVELVIVIGVIAILSAVLIPTFVNLSSKAKEATAKDEVSNAYTAYVLDAQDGALHEDADDAQTDVLDHTMLKQTEIAIKRADDSVYTWDSTKNEWAKAGSVSGTGFGTYNGCTVYAKA